jgi:hypothetical protein
MRIAAFISTLLRILRETSKRCIKARFSAFSFALIFFRTKLTSTTSPSSSGFDTIPTLPFLPPVALLLSRHKTTKYQSQSTVNEMTANGTHRGSKLACLMSLMSPFLIGTTVVIIDITSQHVFRYVQIVELVVVDATDLKLSLAFAISSANLSRNRCLSYAKF